MVAYHSINFRFNFAGIHRAGNNSSHIINTHNGNICLTFLNIKEIKFSSLISYK